ncbi:MAG TPA: putative 2OG-Fe(II) oxygenase [Caulobacteraceae bacterium]
MSKAPSPADAARLEEAQALLRAGSTGRAVGALRSLVAERPDLATAHHHLALALELSGDTAGAESELRAALRLDPLLGAAAAKLALRLIAQGQAAQALEIVTPLAKSAAADVNLLTAQGMALKSLDRLDEAAVAYRRAAAAAPGSGVAEHNLAALLGDAHRFAESQAATKRAFAKGLDAPETWLVHARALTGLDQFDEAEDAFREAIRRRSNYADAHRELAQLIWMRTESLEAARETLDAALLKHGSDGPLSLVKAKLLETTGDLPGAYAALAGPMQRWGSDSNLHLTAANLIAGDDPQLALAYAQKAFDAAPGSGPATAALCQANLALGRADVAANLAAELRQAWPLDQYAVALAATAWRLLGDPRYRELYDYDRFVQVRTIDTPAEWSSLPSFLKDLAARLKSLQRLRGHPFDQSLRGGAQTGQSLALSEDPVIAAFFSAIDAPIRAYLRAIKGRDDVMGARVNEAGYRFAGAWSALLRPGGYHTDHLHPLGWISSACHIALPGAVDNGHEGWLKFGQPGIPTQPALSPEHFVKPKAGDLVLFPSYMWHGTVPFGGAEPRLALAFDVLPA